MRAVELYAGIGGFAAAVPEVEVVRAFDQSGPARAVYQLNHPHAVDGRNLRGVTARELGRLGADLWWMSPPCQPYTRRGAQRGLEDARAASFVHLVACLGEVRPQFVALENVAGFYGSDAWSLLRDVLARAQYEVEEGVVCPSSLGWPNRRPRYYLVAGAVQLGGSPVVRRSLPALVDGWSAELAVDPGAYRHAVHVVDAEDVAAVTTCFTAAYGRSPVRSGSYLRQEGRLRRFAPAEVARLLGFPEGWRMEGAPSTRWGLLGNSLSLPVVRRVLSQQGWSKAAGAEAGPP